MTFTTSLRASLATVLVVSALGLVGCGGGSNNAAVAPVAAVPAGQHAETALGMAGGDVVLASSDGATFTLTIPSGALTANTVIGLTTVSTAPGQRFNLQLLPAGLVLAQGKTATLRISLPPGTALPPAGALVYDGVPIAFARQSDESLQVQISNFAQSSGASAAVAALRRNAVSSPFVRMLAGGGSAPCSGIPQLTGTDGTLSAADAVDINIYGQCMVNAVRALAANAEYGAAVRLASATAAYLQRLGVGNDAGFVRQAGDIACIAYKDAITSALAANVTTMGTLYTVLKPLLFWEGVRQQLGVDCPGIAETDFINITNAKTNEAAAFYASKKGAIVDTTGVEYTEAAREGRAGHDTITQVRSLQPAPALNNLVTVAIEQRAQPSLLDAILQAPWQRCRDSGDYTELLRLWELMDGAQPMKDAIQYCATQIGVQVRDVNNAVSAVLSPGLGGIRVDLRNTSGTLAVNRDSKVELSGNIGTLACPANDNEQLQLTFEGVEVATLVSSGSELLSLSRTLPVLRASDLLRAAGLRDDDSGRHPLVIKRRNSSCAGALGITADVLATVTLDFGREPLIVSVLQAGFGCQYTPDVGPLVETARLSSDLSMPFRFSSGPLCLVGARLMALDQPDANTVVWSSDYNANNVNGPVYSQFPRAQQTPAASGDAVYFAIVFPRDGSLTVSVNPNWITDPGNCNSEFWNGRNTQQILANVQMPVAGLGSGSTAYSPCYVHTDHGIVIPSTRTVAITRGMRVTISGSVMNGFGSMRGLGTAVTAHFTPTP